MKIYIPKSSKDLKIKHFEAYKYIESNAKQFNIMDKVKLISLISEVSIEKLREAKATSIEGLYSKIVDLMSKLRDVSLPLEVNYNDQKYTLRDEFIKHPIGWFIDASSIDFQEQPEMIASLCYIEEGMGYAEKDKHQNVINPLSDRSKVFKEEMPLEVFAKLNAFFLTRFETYKKMKEEIKENRAPSLSSGKQ